MMGQLSAAREGLKTAAEGVLGSGRVSLGRLSMGETAEFFAALDGNGTMLIRGGSAAEDVRGENAIFAPTRYEIEAMVWFGTSKNSSTDCKAFEDKLDLIKAAWRGLAPAADEVRWDAPEFDEEQPNLVTTYRMSVRLTGCGSP